MTERQTQPQKRKRMALGRGLDALIPTSAVEDLESQRLIDCDVTLIRPNRYQPRSRFAEDELHDLCESIKTQGIIQPLVVRKDHVGYELLAGERRLRAAKMAGLKQVPVVIKTLSDADMIEMSIVENIQREDLNPIEEAEAYHRLISEFDITQEQVAERVGKSRSAVANFLRLRQLPAPIKATIEEGTVSMGHARALLGIESPAQQQAAWKKVVSKGLSVRETEALVKKFKSNPVRPPRRSAADQHYYVDLGEQLTRHFGTKVIIKKKGRKGRVEIEYYSDDDLDRLIERLRGA